MPFNKNAPSCKGRSAPWYHLIS